MSVERAGRFVEDAYRLTELGWALIRLDGKIPGEKDWRRAGRPRSEPGGGTLEWVGRRWNMGTLLGARKLAVLEYDLPEAALGSSN